MSFNIQIIEDLSISHFVVVVAITMVTVVTTIVVKDCVSALKRFLSNQKNSKYSKIFLEDIITILGYSVLVWYITKGDEPVSYIGVMGIVVLTILILFAVFTALFHYVSHQRIKEENSNELTRKTGL